MHPYTHIHMHVVLGSAFLFQFREDMAKSGKGGVHSLPLPLALSVAAADWAERLKQSLEQAGSPSGWDQVGYVCVEKAFAKNLSVTGLTSLMKQL